MPICIFCLSDIRPRRRAIRARHERCGRRIWGQSRCRFRHVKQRAESDRWLAATQFFRNGMGIYSHNSEVSATNRTANVRRPLIRVSAEVTDFRIHFLRTMDGFSPLSQNRTVSALADYAARAFLDAHFACAIFPRVDAGHSLSCQLSRWTITDKVDHGDSTASSAVKKTPPSNRTLGTHPCDIHHGRTPIQRLTIQR
ncbi:hypothetical protein FN846DRAFT_457990 [Sphaerosporella brunnea]|uniref:Uncharacterized protein n=1 Tax=Sphaerosporella brunnea TaxID=1250544 RepID=A0A5J5F420_9PEZI|nr:hypothetical protein FN846DRAFT_457990 [Sphaerosporella brunnea]